MKGEFTLEASESARPDYLAGATLALVIQFLAAEEGTYAVELEFGEAWTSLPIHVVLGEPR